MEMANEKKDKKNGCRNIYAYINVNVIQTIITNKFYRP